MNPESTSRPASGGTSKQREACAAEGARGIREASERQAFGAGELAAWHAALEGRGFYGTLTLTYQAGRLVLLTVSETIKPA